MARWSCGEVSSAIAFRKLSAGGHMYQTILDAMKALGETGLMFGSENPQKGESDFQSALGNKLDQMTNLMVGFGATATTRTKRSGLRLILSVMRKR